VNPAPNQGPNANAGIDQTITLPVNIVSLNGSGTDPDGTITAYLWIKISGPATGAITNANSATTSATGLTQGIYRFQLRVTDNSGATDLDTMQVTVNLAPNANAGLDQNITLPTNSASLNGSGTDPDGTITVYLWTKISGPTAGTITNANAAATTATGMVQGIYKFQLRVTDNSGATDLDTMQVTVNPALNQAPTANAGLDRNITLPTNAVSLNGSGTDPDGTIASYLWTKISGPAAGTFTNANSATTSATGLVQGVYQFQLRVTDNSGATATDIMQVTVNPVPNQGPNADAGLDQNITLPTNAVSLVGSGTDPDGTITAYLWTKISGPATGTITNANTALTSVAGLTEGIYQFQLRVTDNSGATDTDLMQVTVNAIPPPPNVAPTANAGSDTSIYIPANAITLSGSGTDPDGFIVSYSWRIISGGAHTLLNANNAIADLAGLLQDNYEAELTVTDNSGATGRDTVKITVGAGRLHNQQDDVRIIGNPVQNLLTAEITSTSVNRLMKVVLFDTYGRVLVEKDLRLTQNVQLEKIDMTKYSRGTYFLQVFFDKKTPVARKVIKI
jgi:ribosomal protein L14